MKLCSFIIQKEKEMLKEKSFIDFLKGFSLPVVVVACRLLIFMVVPKHISLCYCCIIEATRRINNEITQNK